MPGRRALLSVSDKTDLVPFARGLHDRGFELVSTGGTARVLAGAGLPVVGVSEVTRFPEMLDGRVKTLHPAIHAGLLARRHRPDDLAAIAAQGISPIDVVVVNLYPFAKAAANPDTRFDDLIEEIDIGGPSLVRAAAKNFRDVLVVVEPGDYVRVIDALSSPDGPSLAFRFELARRAFAHTAAYDAMIASTLESIHVDGAGFSRGEPSLLPSRLRLDASRVRVLRYGENPHQQAAWYSPGGAQGFGGVQILQGKELSYTNLLDLDAAARIVLEFDEPAAAVIKHTNPCGVAIADSPAAAYVAARDADALSAFGGIVGLNRPLDEETARAITSTFIEAVVAPAVEPAAVEVLARKTNLRVLTADFSAFREGSVGTELRSILGGLLVQERDRVDEGRAPWDARPGADPASSALRVVTKRAPTADEWKALRFAWRVCAHVKSNTILFAGPDRTRAIGAGQMSRVDAVKVAVMKAGGSLAGTVVASDAFFPFRDGLDALAEAGATAVVQPGGSVRDAEVIAAADEHDIAMVFTGRRHFRH
ncbi:MAG TPA: bifunctional phosphoribosylaminoimidazolecarboxamide formyltransferase/IMP cyclohydrolase [Vicinamibacterales bacterium]